MLITCSTFEYYIVWGSIKFLLFLLCECFFITEYKRANNDIMRPEYTKTCNCPVRRDFIELRLYEIHTGTEAKMEKVEQYPIPLFYWNRTYAIKQTTAIRQSVVGHGAIYLLDISVDFWFSIPPKHLITCRRQNKNPMNIQTAYSLFWNATTKFQIKTQ